ncbi:MAG: HD domain-containing protein [bacterium]|nr:HD domain-containing protein [bacterium]
MTLDCPISKQEKERILAEIGKQVKQRFAQAPFEPIHDFTHVLRIVQNIRLICAGEGIDPFVPEIAAWLHDLGRTDKRQSKKFPHARLSAELVPSFISAFKKDLDKEVVVNIQDAVARHSFKNAEDDSLLAMILKDTDRLDGFGAMGVIRAFVFYHDKPIYDSRDPFGGIKTSEEYLHSSSATQIQSLYRQIEWIGWLRVKTAIKMARPKVKLMFDFLYQLACDLGVDREEVNKNPVVVEAKRIMSL